MFHTVKKNYHIWKNGSGCKKMAHVVKYELFQIWHLVKWVTLLKNGSKCEKLVAFGKLCHTVKNCSQLEKCVTLWKWVTFEKNVSHYEKLVAFGSTCHTVKHGNDTFQNIGHSKRNRSNREDWVTFVNLIQTMKFGTHSKMWPIF